MSIVAGGLPEEFSEPFEQGIIQILNGSEPEPVLGTIDELRIQVFLRQTALPQFEPRNGEIVLAADDTGDSIKVTLTSTTPGLLAFLSPPLVLFSLV